jgi:apolipoprotein D and lipocalin family protein
MRYSEMKVIELRREMRAARGSSSGASEFSRGWRLGVLCLVLLGLAVLVTGCASTTYRDRATAMTTNGPVDLARYQGLWYEIARFPNRFEEGCAGVTAEYSLNEDGSIKVLNTCRQGTLDGPVETAEGVATSNSPDNDKLLVTFVPWLPFARGDYWILQTDYEIAVIGSPSGSVGWVLARTTTLPDDRLQQALGVLQRNGYDTSRITFTRQ